MASRMAGLWAGCCALLLFGSACQASVKTYEKETLRKVSWSEAEKILEEKSVYEVPGTEEARTSRDGLFRLADALDIAYEALDFAPPYPAIRIVDGKHWIMKGRRLSVAVRLKSGEERIYIRREHLERTPILAPLIIHEVAHLKAWRRHGVDIVPHGSEFKAICRPLIGRRACKKIEY